MATLKRYEKLVTLLEENQDKMVEAIMPEVYRVTARSSRKQNSVLHDTDGNPVAIRCQFFRKWFPLVGTEASERFSFAPRSHRNSGYAAECREAAKEIARQRRQREKRKKELTDKIVAGELNPQEFAQQMKTLETLPGPEAYEGDVPGFDDAAECRAYLDLHGVDLAD